MKYTQKELTLPYPPDSAGDFSVERGFIREQRTMMSQYRFVRNEWVL